MVHYYYRAATKKVTHPPAFQRCFNHLELDVASTGVGAPGAEDLQGHVAVTIRDLKSADVDDECHWHVCGSLRDMKVCDSKMEDGTEMECL